MGTISAAATHHAEAFRTDDGWWAIRAPGLKFGYTQAERFEDIEDMTRDLIACALDVDEAEVGTIVVSERVWS